VPRRKLSPLTVQPGRLDRDVYTVRELATILALHPEVLQKAIRQGELQANFIGGSAGYRILQDQVLAWLRSRGREPAITNPSGSNEAFMKQHDGQGPRQATASRRVRV
jgi:excisionase family DNA binding protein